MTGSPQPRCAVITGASSGVGKAAATLLAAQGWHVIAHGRDPERSERALADIRAAAAPGARVDMLRADLALLGETAALADEIAALTPRIDALLNNAGGVRPALVMTAEGNEATFAGNHLGHFLLTHRLLPILTATAKLAGPGAGRIVNVSSEGHRVASPIDWDDLQRIADWNSGRSYCQAKLFNLLFTRELARRLAPLGIVANAMHPGEVASNFITHAEPAMQAHMETLNLLPPEVSGRTLAWLASASESGAVTGRYFFNQAELAPSREALDDALAARLWIESEALLAKAGYAASG